MKITRLLKDKRGIAIENAVLFMVVVFMLCALLTSLTLMGFYQTVINTTLLDEKITIDQIGEDFVRKADMKNKPLTQYPNTNFYYESDNTMLTVYRGNDENPPIVLTVVLNNDAVDSWKYGAIESDTEN